jgi:hypothetical protein
LALGRWRFDTIQGINGEDFGQSDPEELDKSITTGFSVSIEHGQWH